MTAPIASIEDVSYQYPGSRADALRHHSWSINPGEVALLVGRSGSGKSTLLRCLNGLVPHYSGGAFGGTVRVAELDTRRAGPRQLSAVTGFVFQDPESQMITDRVEDEVAFTLEQHGVDRSTMRRLVDEALALAGITHLAARRPAELSGGERQRVAIAAALAARPRLLVFDEPTSQLDPEGAASIVRAIGDVSHDTGIAIAIAEHRLDHLLGMASSMQVLNGTVLHGHPREVVPRMDPAPLPAVARLARLLGMPAIPPGLKEARSVAWPDLPASPAPVSSSTGGDLLTRLDRVDVVRARRPVLRDLSLEVREGEMIALLGRNGSGKTTLLRSIAGLQAAQHGRVETLGLDMSRSHPADLAGAAGYVPQHAAALFHRERLVDELTLPTGRAGGWRDPLATLERLGLRAHAERHPLDLSGGERERAALAIALHGGPRLLLLDEPTRGMDAWRKRDLVQLLGELRDEGTGIVMATHDVELAAACATRVVILDEGEVAADGLPGDVLPRHPAFRPQINALFGGSWLTVSQILAAIDGQRHRAPVTMATMR